METDLEMGHILAQLRRIDRQVSITNCHWVEAELVGHKIQRVDFIICRFH